MLVGRCDRLTRLVRVLRVGGDLTLLSATLKQILGYGEGKDAIFHETVLVPYNQTGALELGLVTNHISPPDGGEMQLVIFVPGSPNPTAGRLVLLPKSAVKRVDMAVDEALKALVSVGKTDLPGQTPNPGGLKAGGK